MEERNAQLERDVARYQERRRIEKEVGLTHCIALHASC